MSDATLDLVCSKIREALSLEDNPKKKPKTSKFKAVACEALDISKMGEARWTMVLDYGVKNSYFYLSEDKLTISLDAPTSAQKEVDECEEEGSSEGEEMDSNGYYPSEYLKGSSSLLKTSTTRPRDPQEYSLEDGTPAPKKGDIVWVNGSNGVYQGEVKEVTFGAVIYPLNGEEGHWGYYKADELYDNKRQAQVCQAPKNMYWSTKALSPSEYAQFRAYQKHREQFLRWLNQEGIEPIPEPIPEPTPPKAEEIEAKPKLISEEANKEGMFDDLL